MHRCPNGWLRDTNSPLASDPRQEEHSKNQEPEHNRSRGTPDSDEEEETARREAEAEKLHKRRDVPVTREIHPNVANRASSADDGKHGRK